MEEGEIEMREDWRHLNVKEKSAIITAMVAFVVGWGLTIAGFIVPPLGEVADSVLWILGQALVYSASVFGITTYFTSETKKLKREIREYVERGARDEE